MPLIPQGVVSAALESTVSEQRGPCLPRCLLAACRWSGWKGILKKFMGQLRLTHFACRSGQTSSMLGGAQFKATLRSPKHMLVTYKANGAPHTIGGGSGEGSQQLGGVGACLDLLLCL